MRISQWFQAVEVFAGSFPTPMPALLKYELDPKAERPVLEGKQLIWVARRPEGGQRFGVKALLDTPANRELVKIAASTDAFPPCRAFLEAIRTGDRRILEAITDVPFALDRKRTITDRQELLEQLDALVKRQSGKPIAINTLASAWPAAGLNLEDAAVKELAARLDEWGFFQIVFVETDQGLFQVQGMFEAIVRRTMGDRRFHSPVRVVGLALGPASIELGDKWKDWLQESHELLLRLERQRERAGG